MDITDKNFIVEVVDRSQLADDELSEFKETRPIKLEDVKQENEELLIKKYINGEVSFPAIYTTYEEEDDDGQQGVLKFTKTQPTTSNTMLYNDQDNVVKKRTLKRRTALNPALQGLMGEANLSFVRGNLEITEKICLEIIRQNPLTPEPFYTLAQIYETKDPEKFLNFSTIAAHLDPNNRDQWIRIAEINLERNNYAQARVLYSKAIKHHQKDYDLRLRKAKILEMMGEHRDAMYTYLFMIQHIPENQAVFCLETAKTVAKYYYEHNKMNFALEAMKTAYGIIPYAFSMEDLNLYLELLIINQSYENVLFTLRDHCQVGLIINTTNNEQNKIEIISCSIPDKLEPDFRVKLCVSLIYLKAFHLLNYIIENIFQWIPTQDGIDLYMDITDALMNNKKYNEALQLLGSIIKTEENSPALVWLRTGDCYRELEQIEDAIQSYYKVVSLAPLCYDAKFTLSALLKQQGRHHEAIKALEQDMDGDSINPRLLYERCLMLKTIDEIDQYMEVGYLLLARNSLKFRTREELIACSSGGNNFNPDSYKTIRESRFDSSDNEPEYNEAEANLTTEEEYELFKDIAKTAFENKKFAMIEKLCFAMATTKRFRNKHRELEKIIILACLYNDDPVISFLFFREILPKNLQNNSCWNLMNIIIQTGDDVRYHRYLKRLLTRHACAPYLRILLSNYHLVAGSYKYALNIYVAIFKEILDPLVCLCIGICFNQIALQKNSVKKATGVAQAVAFLKKYSDLRMSPSTKQETLYNLGRLYHQAGVIYLALYYYEQALEVSDSLIDENSNVLGLKEEIAFNLSLIYKSNGNIEMARKYLYKYCVV